MSPDMVSPGLESIWNEEGDKEVVVPQEANRNNVPHIEPLPLDPLAERRSKRFCGSARTKLCWIILVAAVVVAVALGVGLGVGLKHHNSGSSSSARNSTTTSDYSIGGALDPSYYSTQGAFNGSGLAIASYSFDADDHGSIVLYFQHHTGQIRYLQLNNGDWEGGDESTIVAPAAKNGTPISAVAYALDSVTYVSLSFFVDISTRMRVNFVYYSGTSSSLTKAITYAKEQTATRRIYGKMD